MKKETFTGTYYGQETTLHLGQKVECTYYHEYSRLYMKDAYKRKWWQLFDLPFKPVKLGVIVGDAGVHPFWLGDNDRKEQYLLVKFKEYFFAKPIPMSCMEDTQEAADKMERILKADQHRIGEKGYSMGSYLALKNQAEKGKSF